MSKLLRIALDGPSGAGKSTMAKLLAKEYGIDYIDTGAMYRALGLKILKSGINYEDPAQLKSILDTTDVDYYDGKVWLDGVDVSGVIRTQEISDIASKTSAIVEVRDKLGESQMAMAKKRSMIMDGRDIGTIIIPDAEFKFYLVASSRVRAERRYKELVEKGQTCDLDQVEQEIIERDYRDSHRDYHPLKKADDAIEVDTSNLTIQQVIDTLKGIINA